MKTKRILSGREEMEGRDGTCEVTEDTTILVQSEEEKCALRKLSFVTKLILVGKVSP